MSTTTEQIDTAAARVVADVPKRLYLGGQWRDATDEATFDVLDPSTGEVLCSVADASPTDGRAALDAAVAAQSSFAAVPPY